MKRQNTEKQYKITKQNQGGCSEKQQNVIKRNISQKTERQPGLVTLYDIIIIIIIIKFTD